MENTIKWSHIGICIIAVIFLAINLVPDSDPAVIAEAKGYLKQARAMQNVKLCIGLMYADIDRANSSLERIGTSEKEVADMLKKEDIVTAKNSARQHLQSARSNMMYEDVGYYISQLRIDVEKADIALEQIGTSEKELANMLTQGQIAEAKLDAKKWLQKARANAPHCSVMAEVSLVHINAHKAGITLEQIGTSKKELADMLDQGDMAQARVYSDQ